MRFCCRSVSSREYALGGRRQWGQRVCDLSIRVEGPSSSLCLLRRILEPAVHVLQDLEFWQTPESSSDSDVSSTASTVTIEDQTPRPPDDVRVLVRSTPGNNVEALSDTETLSDSSTETLLSRSTGTLSDSSTATLSDSSTETLSDSSTETLSGNETC